MNKWMILSVLFTSQSFAGPLRDLIIKRMQNRGAPEISETVKKVNSGGVERFYSIHLPKTYSPGKKAPLVLALHGGGGNMTHMSLDKNYGLTKKAENSGFIIVFPNGYSQLKSGKFATWNAGKCCGQGRDTKSQDVQFIRDLISKMISEFDIDQERIYAIGMSNGGMMSYRLACELSDVLKGIASVAGTDNTIDCNPKKPISILHIHAKDDTHVLFNGGAGKDAFKDLSQVTDFVSVPETMAKWKKLDGCDQKPQTLNSYCELSQCRGTKLQLCVIPEGGHSWPQSAAFNANDVIWDFFKSLK